MLGLRVIHKRSKSFPDKKRIEEDGADSSFEASHHKKLDMATTKHKQLPKVEVGNSLKEEILQLEKRLQDQFQVRCALEKALGYRTLCFDNMAEIPISKAATELIKEIAVLEMEVVCLEQHLLSLYRKAFDERVSSVSPSKRVTQSYKHQRKDCKSIGIDEKLLDSGVHRCHSSLSHRSAFSTERVVRPSHSQPLSTIEYGQNTLNIISLAEHLGTRISDHVQETPNKISEEMIKCMSVIYCKLSDPHNGLSSPNSLISAYSPQHTWSPEGFRNNSSFDVRLDNPFLVQGLKEFSGPYSTMLEVPWIYRDSQKLGEVENLLQRFRSLVCRLEEVDPRRLKHEEKLAFWINVHNALVMHAYLAYGIPQNNVKRLLLLLKTAYKIGGYTISADTIQNSILGCQISRPAQWLRLLLSTRPKFKTRDERQAYTIENPEPLLHFALCSGSHSDPAVRVYTPQRIFQELEAAKEEYIRATFGVIKDRKILLPKIVESFAKDSGICQVGVIEMIQKTLPESVRKNMKKCQLGKSKKSIEWIPHNFSFRFLISKELVR